MRQAFQALLILTLLAFTTNRCSDLYAANEAAPPAPYEEMVYTASGTTFTLWSPTATQVRVNLYKEGRGGEPYQEIQLKDQNDDPLQVTFGNGSPIYTVASKLRKSYQAINAISFDTALSNGSLILTMKANTTSDIVGRYVYDAELTSSTAVIRIIEGIVTVTPRATK